MPTGKPQIDVQPRDLALLRGLFESRVMALPHVAALYFGGKTEAAKKRVQKLKAAGFIRERPRRAFEPGVLFLTTKAFDLLAERGVLNDYPRLQRSAMEKRAQVSELTIRHELEVMAVKTVMVSAINQHLSLRVVEFSTWPLLYKFWARRSSNDGFGRGQEVEVKPDGFIRIHEKEPDGGNSEHVFFLELDRSTEKQEILAQRAACYLDYYKSGGLAQRFGRSREAFKDFPFRVLMVFRNAERRNNTAERLLRLTPPILTQVCLATFDQLIAEPLGRHCIRPLDYREITCGTRYDPARGARQRIYRRDPERESWIERFAERIALLGS